MKLFIELSSKDGIEPPVQGVFIDDPTYQYVVEINSQNELNALYQYIGYHPDFISGFIPNENLIALSGPGLSSRWNEHERQNFLNEEFLRSYHHGCKYLAHAIEDFNPRYVYLPLRGAMPIWRIVKKYFKSINPIEFTPATSSFIFYPGKKLGKRRSARFANILSINRIYKNFAPGRIAYIDEIVSGSMMLGHLRKIVDIMGRTEWIIGAFGLADAEGHKFRHDTKQRLVNFLKNKTIEIFDYQPVKRLLGEDDRRFGGFHYLDYKKGPIVVPFLNERDEYYREYIELNNFIL